MAGIKFHNLRGGVIRLASDAPVYFGVATEINLNIAEKLITSPFVKAYLDSGSLVAHYSDGRIVGKAADKFRKDNNIKPPKARAKQSKEVAKGDE